MTHIRNAQGNNLTEVMSDTINQVVGQFSEGINAMFSGFKSFGQNFSTGNFAPNGQQHTTLAEVSNISTSESFKDNVHRQMKASEAEMQSREVDFFGGAEDTRAVSQIKQFGAT